MDNAVRDRLVEKALNYELKGKTSGRLCRYSFDWIVAYPSRSWMDKIKEADFQIEFVSSVYDRYKQRWIE